jgi:hypothetical protein
MTASAKRRRVLKQGRQKDWPKRRAPIARLRRTSRATPKRPGGELTNAGAQTSPLVGISDRSRDIRERPWTLLT